MREQVIERIEKEKLIAIVQRRFDGEEIGEVGVMFDAAERMATYEDKNADDGAADVSVKK